MRRPSTTWLSSLFVSALLVGATFITTAPTPALAATAAAITTCSNGVDDTPGLGLICEVTVVNSITSTGGSAKVTIRECHGAAGAPTASCTTTTTSLTKPVTAVTQCNDSINGAGGTLRCSVKVTNHFSGITPKVTAVTVNQCVGSGDGITIGCDPFPSTTTGARVTQCNGSANGGTLVGLTCTATGTKTSSHAVTVNQCNGSANGGGSLVICSASQRSTISSNRSGSGGGSGSGGSAPSAPATSTVSATSGAAEAATFPVGVAFLGLVGVLTLAFVLRPTRRPLRRVLAD